MQIIDLLNKIANGEKAPKTIKYRGLIFDYDDIDYYNTDLGYLFEQYVIFEILNDVVNIIEEKKIPEEIKDKYCSQISKVELAQKYNEIIDYLKSKGY